MISYILTFGAGAVCASVIWFFVWRNNKKLVAEQLVKLDGLVNKVDK